MIQSAQGEIMLEEIKDQVRAHEKLSLKFEVIDPNTGDKLGHKFAVPVQRGDLVTLERMGLDERLPPELLMLIEEDDIVVIKAMNTQPHLTLAAHKLGAALQGTETVKLGGDRLRTPLPGRDITLRPSATRHHLQLGNLHLHMTFTARLLA